MLHTCILHAGMHKTGSTSIQHTLSSMNLEDYDYPEFVLPNHSELLQTVFMDNPEKYHINVIKGYSYREIINLRRQYKNILHESIKKAGKTGKSGIIISAESLSLPGEQNKLYKIREFLNGYCSEIKVIGYVRPPVAFMQSLFQEIIRNGGNRRLCLMNLYPEYRERFEQIDRVFGRDNVKLIKYSTDDLYRGDVVKDFANRLEIELPDEEIKNLNETLLLEAVAVLYMYYSYGSKKTRGYASAPGHSKKLADHLSQIGKTKLQFGPELVRPVLDEFSKDIEWMEVRLGEVIYDFPDNGDDRINSENDLLNVALRQGKQLGRLANKNLSSEFITKQSVIDIVDDIRNELIKKERLFHRLIKAFERLKPGQPGQSHG
jgi:hypothetical protein